MTSRERVWHPQPSEIQLPAAVSNILTAALLGVSYNPGGGSTGP